MGPRPPVGVLLSLQTHWKCPPRCHLGAALGRGHGEATSAAGHVPRRGCRAEEGEWQQHCIRNARGTSPAAGEREAGVNGVYHTRHASIDRMDCWHDLGPPVVPLRDASLGDCGKVAEKELLSAPADTHARRATPPSALPHNTSFSASFKDPKCEKTFFCSSPKHSHPSFHNKI